MTIELLQGAALDVLRSLPDESVHCIITSPPYWGLRSYGTEPQIWRNGSEPCQEHQWETQERNPQPHGDDGYSPSSTLGGGKGTQAQTRMGAVKQDTCTRCGAWRGELGLEPTPELFVEHIVAVMREARRVLRADGTLWCNLGDAYAHSTSGGGGAVDVRRDGRKTTLGDKVRGRMAGANTMVAGLKPKDLVGIPWRVAFALQADGWYLRSDIIWSKPNPMPESVRDRPTKAHEYLFLLAKQPRYYYDADAVREDTGKTYTRGASGYDSTAYLSTHTGGKQGAFSTRDVTTVGRNRRSVWTVTTHPYSGAHFATFPPKLVEPMVLAATSERGVCPACGAPWVREVKASGGTIGKSWHEHDADLERGMSQEGCSGLDNKTNEDGTYKRETLGWRASCSCDAGEPIPATVLDPFNGAGTTGLVALQHGRKYIGIELKAEYIEMTRKRLANAQIEMAT